MKEKKLTFIIPGFRHTPTSKAYKKVASILKAAGHKPISIKIPWKERTISENTSYFLDQYKRKMTTKGQKTKKQKTYFLGFSFGAMIAFLASTKVKVDGLILCSLSPYFKEDLPKTKRHLRSTLQESRYEDFAQLRCSKLTKKIKAKKILMLYGSKESKPLIRRVMKTYKQITSKRKYLLSIQDAEHDINNAQYLRTIHHITTQFL